MTAFACPTCSRPADSYTETAVVDMVASPRFDGMKAVPTGQVMVTVRCCGETRQFSTWPATAKESSDA